jgi:LPS export ABC transporter protein LptC
LKIFLFVGVVFLVSCGNDLNKIKEIRYSPNDPEQKTVNLALTYTDEGKAKVRLFAPLAEMFLKPDKMIFFKQGVKVEFYNDNGDLSSILTAKYGEINESQGTMKVEDSVRLFSPIKKERMQTEALFWNRTDSTIFTDRMVSIYTATSILYGEGVRTKQDFSTYEFLKPRGKVQI